MAKMLLLLMTYSKAGNPIAFAEAVLFTALVCYWALCVAGLG